MKFTHPISKGAILETKIPKWKDKYYWENPKQTQNYKKGKTCPPHKQGGNIGNKSAIMETQIQLGNQNGNRKYAKIPVSVSGIEGIILKDLQYRCNIGNRWVHFRPENGPPGGGNIGNKKCQIGTCEGYLDFGVSGSSKARLTIIQNPEIFEK